MSLTVTTLTKYENQQWLDRCQQSVALALPEGATHKIIHCPATADFNRIKFESGLVDEFVAFVDDDDTIDPMALKRCMVALEETGAGIACTDQVLVSLDQELIYVDNKIPKTYRNVATFPTTLHHLVVFRSSAVPHSSLLLANKYGVGIDWLIRAGMALEHGAVYVPMSGYYWTQRPNSKMRHEWVLFKKHTQDMRNDIERLWGPSSLKDIPIHMGYPTKV